jgi:hypothetical protein
VVRAHLAAWLKSRLRVVGDTSAYGAADFFGNTTGLSGDDTTIYYIE